MNQSASGFDIGLTKAVGSFYSVNRQMQTAGDEAKGTNFLASEDMKGRKYIKHLIDQQEDRYQKRIPFERGQYH